jgi:hypothetical protein
MIRTALFAALLTTPGHAGTRLLQNDGFTGHGKVGFQGGFVAGECWGVSYVPSAGDYPFDFDHIQTLVGGNSSTEQFSVNVYDLGSSTDIARGTLVGSTVVQITGSQEALTSIASTDFEEAIPSFTAGNVGVSICQDHHTAYPSIARDTDGMAYADRNWIYAEVGGGAYHWYRSQQLSVTGDWIQRLCIEGANISGDGCEGDSDADADADTDTDGDADADTGHGSLFVDSITPDHTDPGVPVDVIVLGGGFADGVVARIGGMDLSGITVLGDTTLQGRSPSALPEGVHDVEVVLGSENDVLEAAFTVGGCGGCSPAGGAAGLALPALLWVTARMRRRG